MDLFTVTPYFIGDQVIDQFVSVIWTERYNDAGDVTLVVPDTPFHRENLKPGALLRERSSREVMLLETRSIENGLMTVIGQSLLGFLRNRLVWYGASINATGDYIGGYHGSYTPGRFLANLIYQMVINPVPFVPTSNFGRNNLDWAADKIPNLSLGYVYDVAPPLYLVIPAGPIYENMVALAKQYDLGLSMYLESSSPGGYSLKFTVYKGLDRTSGQTANRLVRLYPAMDSLSDVKEVESVDGYANVAYLRFGNQIYIRYANPSAPLPEGFARRVVEEELKLDPGQDPFDPTDLTGISNWIDGQAKNILANHNYISAVDGQMSPGSLYKFGSDYYLGDKIELATSVSDTVTVAQITEYIRSQDDSSEREYPTISIL